MKRTFSLDPSIGIEDRHQITMQIPWPCHIDRNVILSGVEGNEVEISEFMSCKRFLHFG